MSGALNWLQAVETNRRSQSLERRLRPFSPDRPGFIRLRDRSLLNLGSNDYLGLASDPRVLAAAAEAIQRTGWGATASPLVCGWGEDHQALCEALAEFEDTEAALLFPTGFAANLGAIVALIGPGDVVYSDKKNHACLIEGAKLSGARFRVYPHADADRLDHLMARDRQSGEFRRALIATDSVFSMDGTLAPLPRLVEIAEKYEAMLLIDEAHGTGVFGPSGRGASEVMGVSDRISIKVGTLSKALGSIGGFAAGSRRLIDHLIHHAPTFMFSTGLPHAAAAAAHQALQIVRAEPWRREQLHQRASALRFALRAQGWKIPESEGPIIPILLGESQHTLQLARRLEHAGFFVPAIRPPTVPRGTSRLRLSLTAAHSDEALASLVRAMGLAAEDPSLGTAGQADPTSVQNPEANTGSAS